MAWLSAFACCLTVGGCVAGITLGTLNGMKSNETSDVSQTFSKGLGGKKGQFFNKLRISSTCLPAYFSDSEEERFGTIHVCPDGSLYYLEEENAFDWSKSIDSLMSLFKEVKKFNYKKEGASQTYLLIDLEDGLPKRKVFVDPLEPKENWNSYKGFTPSL